MTVTPAELLHAWLRAQTDAESMSWLDGRRESLAGAYTDRTLHITLGMIPRRVGKADLDLGPDDLEAANRARAGWDPRGWSVADAARVLVILDTAGAGNEPFETRLTDLCRTADVAEAIALYRGLPLYPAQAALEPLAAEGLRTNMRTVFEAVAHRNPYPREQFDEGRWNQMVLKALFVDSTLYPILGIDERANPDLARILCDYAHERWAAARPVSPELWRCVGPHARGAMVEDLARVLANGTPVERRAAAVALGASADEAAAAALAQAPDLADEIHGGRLTWTVIETDLGAGD